MSFGRLLSILAMIAAFGSYVFERAETRRLETELHRSHEETAELQARIEGLSQKLSGLQQREAQADGALSQKIAAKKAAIADLQSRLDLLLNGGNRNYSAQDDQSRVAQLKSDLKAAQNEAGALEGRKRELLASAKNSDAQSRKSSDAYYRDQLQVVGRQIDAQKQQIHSTQDSIQQIKHTRPFDMPTQIQQLSAQLDSQRRNLDQLNQQRDDLKAQQAQARAQGPASPPLTDDLDAAIGRAKERVASLQRDLNATSEDWQQAATRQKAVDGQVQSLRRQLEALKAELSDLQAIH